MKTDPKPEKGRALSGAIKLHNAGMSLAQLDYMCTSQPPVCTPSNSSHTHTHTHPPRSGTGFDVGSQRRGGAGASPPGQRIVLDLNYCSLLREKRITIELICHPFFLSTYRAFFLRNDRQIFQVQVLASAPYLEAREES